MARTDSNFIMIFVEKRGQSFQKALQSQQRKHSTAGASLIERSLLRGFGETKA